MDETNETNSNGFQNQQEPIYYVGVGASAGGLEAIEDFFSKMPPDTGMAFIVVQHLSPNYKSLMPELLSKRTVLPVITAENDMEVRPNCIYLIPHRKNMTIYQSTLVLIDQSYDRGVNLPIDIFFKSMAEDLGDKAISVVLSGTGSDGTRGIRAVKEAGGWILVQDEETAKFDGMPRSAIATGLPDLICSPTEMTEQLIRFSKRPNNSKGLVFEDNKKSDESRLQRIFSFVREKHKIDFTFYKPSTVVRRIERRMTVNQIDSLQGYIDFIQNYPTEITILYRELLIGVTNFFRDPQVFEILQDKLLPELITNSTESELRIWVAGCSTGEEAYTYAIIFSECIQKLGIKKDIKIFATDLDAGAIATASAGIYPESISADIAPELVAKYFQKKGDSYHVSRSIREKVVFAQHNLIKDPPFTNIDLISCRNLLIYFQTILQKKALQYFNFALKSMGLMVLGTSETTGEFVDYFETLETRWKIFQSKGRKKPPEKLELESPDVHERKRPYQSSILRSSYSTAIHEDKVMERTLSLISADYYPFAIIVNEHLDLIYLLQDSHAFLRNRFGRGGLDVSQMVPKEISIPMTTGVQKVLKKQEKLIYSNVRFDLDEKSFQVTMVIKPVPGKSNDEPLFGVFITETETKQPPLQTSEGNNYDIGQEAEQRIYDLEQELQLTRENLQATIEELETSNEELQATNEELLASNEELQSTNEELQSVNEELITVNGEHQQKIVELTELSNDIDNLLDSTRIATLFLEHDLKIRKFTPETSKIYRILKSDYGRSIADLTHDLVDVDPTEVIRKVLDSNKPENMEVQDRSGNWYLMRILPYRVSMEYYSGVVITFIDISRIKKADQKAKESRITYSLASKGNDMGHWEWDVGSDKVTWSTSLPAMFGMEKGTFGGTYADFMAKVHPEDRKQVQNAVEQALDSQKEYTTQHRIILPDGNVKWISETGELVLDENQQPLKMIGVAKDITHTKELEQELFIRNSSFNTDHATVITDKDVNIIDMNQSYMDMTGFSKNELLQKNPNILRSDKQDESFYKDMWEQINKYDFWKGKLWNKKKDDELFFVDLTIRTIRDETGKIQYYVGHYIDLTDLKHST